MPSPRRTRAILVATLAALAVAACRGRNDGNRDSYGGSSDGAGGSPPPGPRAGQSADTTTAPAGASATPAASPAPGTAGAPGASARPDSAKGGA
jgi:hypothetical protein